MFAKPAEGFDVFAPENVAPLVGFLASPEAQRISGHVLIVWGKDVTVLGAPSTEHEVLEPRRWTLASLHQQLAPHFEKLEPVKDGFTVPPA